MAARKTIRILDPLVAQQVAAGEVVERPASVVKELIENSLDAHASRIEVEIEDGGTSRILVRDDGEGMSEEDARLSVLRHATSKIRSVEDLEAVSTLGFRGEALPSIASVCRFELTTSDGASRSGTRVCVEGGSEAEVSAASHPRGTTVIVERLFYNVPARRAFLRGIRSERATIMDVVTHLAICNPQVAFRLSEGGREHLSLPAAKDLLERLAQIHGVARARAFREVSYESGAFRIKGYAALPSVHTSSRNASQTVSVNGRWVRSENLNRGLDDAYRATVPAGRYPPVALLIEVDPKRVDVNVHPAKQIVRFSDERAAREAVTAAVRLAIEWRPHPTVRPPEVPSSPALQHPLTFQARREETTPRRAWPLRVAEERRSYPEADLRELQREASRAARAAEESGSPPEEVPERGALPSLEEARVIGQLARCYILLEDPSGLWVVDQHVAHERAILDRLAGPDGPPQVQDLLVPEVVELSPSEAEHAADSLEELALYGFRAEPFGPHSVRVSSAPSILAGREVAGALFEALTVIGGDDPGPRREERILATIACHSAVRMGDGLSQKEMENLIREWLTSRLPATCPHGRSICFLIGTREIARKLDRH
ncbi:DNA mismatch repair endonuclease MutL [Rubrobacter calidifluminis]|uniref:DNA mismatch repair endonuclease MutL n=1 Tax=Rubrobacter calidifluminis TaxID=1392640 RepID=UPI00235FCB90|nr:DNA mismatch repair endonuclease MutL [Rubrobacter calidifluminis]